MVTADDVLNAFECVLAEAIMAERGCPRVVAGDYARTIRLKAESAARNPRPRIDCSHCGAEDVGRVYADRCAMCGCHFAKWSDGFRAWTEALDQSAHFGDTYQLTRAQAAVLLGDLDRMAKVVARGKVLK